MMLAKAENNLIISNGLTNGTMHAIRKEDLKEELALLNTKLKKQLKLAKRYNMNAFPLVKKFSESSIDNIKESNEPLEFNDR